MFKMAPVRHLGFGRAYDVISDHSQFVFDGPKILLKLHFDRV